MSYTLYHSKFSLRISKILSFFQHGSDLPPSSSLRDSGGIAGSESLPTRKINSTVLQKCLHLLYSMFAPAQREALDRCAFWRNLSIGDTMAKITVQVRNNTSDDKIAKVIDRFAGGNREVDGSPFPLAGGEVSPSFGVNVGSDGIGKVDYQFEGGGYNAGEEIEDGKVLDLD